MCKTTCLIQVYVLNMYYICRNTQCNTCVADTCVMYMFYTCNTHKIPHMHYRCGTIGHVLGNSNSQRELFTGYLYKIALLM